MARAANHYAVSTTQTTRQQYPLARFSSIAKKTLGELSVKRASLNIVLVGEQRMKALAAHRGKNRAVNVLSFPYRETPDEVMGDIFICPAVVKKEAKKYGRTTHEHLVALLIHGIVHLTGRTHETDAKAEKMEALERNILSRVSVK